MNDQVQEPGDVGLGGVGWFDLGVEQADQPLDVFLLGSGVLIVQELQQVQREGNVSRHRSQTATPTLHADPVNAELLGEPDLGEVHAC